MESMAVHQDHETVEAQPEPGEWIEAVLRFAAAPAVRRPSAVVWAATEV
jgi:hypothetical protein